jgi:hypothetical protein
VPLGGAEKSQMVRQSFSRRPDEAQKTTSGDSTGDHDRPTRPGQGWFSALDGYAGQPDNSVPGRSRSTAAADLPWRASGERIVRLLRRRSPGCALREADGLARAWKSSAVVAEP